MHFPFSFGYTTLHALYSDGTSITVYVMQGRWTDRERGYANK